MKFLEKNDYLIYWTMLGEKRFIKSLETSNTLMALIELHS